VLEFIFLAFLFSETFAVADQLGKSVGVSGECIWKTIETPQRRIIADGHRNFLSFAGYLPSEPNVKSIRAEFAADVFDRLTSEKQEAVLGVLDAMANDVRVSRTVQSIRSDASNPLAGFDLHSPHLIRIMANALIAAYQMTEPVDIGKITADTQALHYKWGDLPQSTQERIIGLIRYKLTLDYDPTMVETEWRD